MGYYEFPHTRNYDTDLGYLIKRYFELSTDFESLEKNFNDLKAWCIAQLNSEALKTLVANKLDEWLQDGTLEALINNPLNHVTTYDTIVEMITHSALLEGSKIYCTGADTINDGKGGHFRIRARLSSDVIDNYNLYVIDGGIKVAERIIDDLSRNKKYIFISDSYGDRDNSWIDYTINKLGLTQTDYYSSVHTGYGFKPSYNGYFITLLQNLDPIVLNKDNITDIIVGGGFNDRGTDSDELFTAITEFVQYAHEHYKNAIIHIGAIGWSFNAEFQAQLNNGKYIGTYMRCNELPYTKFIKGSNYIMHNFDYFVEEPQEPYTLILGHQYVHPNINGAKEIANCIYAHLNNNDYNLKIQKEANLELDGNIRVVSGTYSILELLNNDSISFNFNISGALKIACNDQPATSNTKITTIELGTLKNGLIGGTTSQSGISPTLRIPTLAYILTEADNLTIPAYLQISYNRLYLMFQTNITTKVLQVWLFQANGIFNNVQC